MESSTLHSNLSATPVPAVLNRPRFYDDLEPMSPSDSLYNGDYDSYKVQNTTPLINDDDMICGWEEPQKKLKMQENKGVIVGLGNKSGEPSNTRTHDIKVSLNKDQVPKNRRNCVQPSISQVINIDDDEEDEDVVELISDEECIIVEKPNKNKAVKSPSLVMKENASGIYTAIAKKRIEEEEYRRAVEHRQQQYFLSLRMRQYMYFMAQQNRMQGAQQQWNGLLNSANQFAYDQTIGNNKSEEDQSTSAATSVSHEQRFQPLQISITLDKETDFDFLEQQEEYDDSNAQNITTLEQKFYLKQSNLNGSNEVVKRKRGRPRKYKPLDENAYQESNGVYQEDSPQTTRIIRTTKKQKEIETVVGEEFQVRILPYTLNTKKQNVAKRAPKLAWNPELIQKDALDTYMADLSRVTRQEISNEETALDLLKGCGMDIAKTLEVVRKNKQLYRKVFEVAVRTSSDPKV